MPSPLPHLLSGIAPFSFSSTVPHPPLVSRLLFFPPRLLPLLSTLSSLVFSPFPSTPPIPRRRSSFGAPSASIFSSLFDTGLLLPRRPLSLGTVWPNRAELRASVRSYLVGGGVLGCWAGAKKWGEDGGEGGRRERAVAGKWEGTREGEEDGGSAEEEGVLGGGDGEGKGGDGGGAEKEGVPRKAPKRRGCWEEEMGREREEMGAVPKRKGC